MELRKSKRKNFGKPPERFGWAESLPTARMFSQPSTDLMDAVSDADQQTRIQANNLIEFKIPSEVKVPSECKSDIEEPFTFRHKPPLNSTTIRQQPEETAFFDFISMSNSTLKQKEDPNVNKQIPVDNLKIEKSSTKASSQRRKLAELKLRAIDEEEKLIERELALEKQKIQQDRTLLQKRLAIEYELENSLSGSDSENLSQNGRILNWIHDVDQAEHKNDPVNEKDVQLKIVKDIEKSNDERNSVKENDQTELMLKFATAICDGLKNITKTSSGYKTLKDKELPLFYGNSEDYPIFELAYKRLNKIYNYSEEENLILLQKCLKGNALDTVKPLLVSEKNLQTILDTLKATFGKPEVIMENLIEKAKSYNAIKEEDLPALQKFSTIVQNIAVTAETLNVEAYNSNPSVVKELLNKLTSNLRYQWARFLKEKDIRVPTLSNFASWIKEETDTLSYYLGKTVTGKDNRSRNNVNAVTTVASKTENDDKKRGCFYCADTKYGENDHSIYRCQKFKELEVDNRWKWVTAQKLCFCCLRGRHQVKKCPHKKPCGKNGCIQYHNGLLHSSVKRVDMNREPGGVKEEQPQPEVIKATATGITNFIQKKQILMKILPVTLYYGNKHVDTYAFLDGGSDTTLIDEDFAKEVGFRGTRDPLELTLAGEHGCNDMFSEVLQLSISGIGSDEIFLLEDVRTMKNLRLPTQTIDLEKWINRWPHLMTVPAECYQNATPKLLIGLDNSDLMVPLQIVKGKPNAPVAAQTKLGWVIYGNYSTYNNFKPNHNNFYISTYRDDKLKELDDMFSSFIEAEKFGINENKNEESRHEKDNAVQVDTKFQEATVVNTDLQKAENSMTKTCRFDETTGRWEIGLLWKDEAVIMPESKKAALRRLQRIEKDMDYNPTLARQYCNQIQEYIEKGYAELLSENEAKTKTAKTWYLPHFSVRNPNKPEKFRFVFDAKAKSQGVSFNDHLLTGPDLLTSLPAILFKFRIGKIGVAGDIAEMFLRIQIRSEDRDAQRFLWRGMEREEDPRTYRMRSMIFGSICSPSCAIYILRRNAEQFLSEYPEVAEAVQKFHYMDDYVDSRDSAVEAEKIIRDVIAVHDKGGFKMRNWITNSEEVRQAIPKELQKEKEVEKVLGVCWKLKEDTLHVHLGSSALSSSEGTPTKRNILKIVMAVYDPFGLTAPIIVKGKIFLQELWKDGIKWDEAIPTQFLKEYEEIVAAIKDIKQIEIPRCYSIYLEIRINLQSHTFCDASEKAFAAVIYFRIATSEGKIATAFVIAKTRVAPIRKKEKKEKEEAEKELTIPKLELQAAKLGTLLFHTVKRDHTVQINESYFWTDSMIALGWIQSKKPEKLPVFMRNRVEKINEITEKSDWNWIPTELNIADIATRGNVNVSSIKTGAWLKGPEFLLLEKEHWPLKKDIRKKEEAGTDTPFLGRISSTGNSNKSTTLIDISRFSNYLRLIRAAAWVFRFVKNVKEKVQRNYEELSATEIKQAESFLLKQAQEEMFKEEKMLLEKGKEIPRKSKLYTLTPVLEDGILKVSGRLSYGEEIQPEMKKPIILDSKHHMTKLIMNHYHRDKHQGTEAVLCELKTRFWIIGGRVALKNIRKNCVICKLLRAKPQVPQMAPLPEFRLTRQVRPFNICGLDYFGPMKVTIGRRQEKRYGALFTCMQTRAVHLEIAHSLTTDSAIMAIQRMIARRGPSEKIYSDNGSNFQGANAELQRALEELDQSKLQQFCSTKGIDWHFIPARTPHFGGAWERLVKSVKDTLQVILKEQAPKEEVLQTLFTEVEWTLNSRPLTTISDDPKDLECLTPNHFLVGQHRARIPYGAFDEDDLILKKAWRKAQWFADQFWKRWTKEYLVTLNKRPKWFHGSGDSLKEGDLVVIMDENSQRNTWPKGLVSKCYEGKDGEVRVVEVQTAWGVYKRPAAKIIRIRGAENVTVPKIPE